MTLLEALVGLVILSLAALGFLGVFQTTAHSARDAAVWVQTVQSAEAVMEQTKVGAGVVESAGPAGFTQAVSRQPWSVPGIEEVKVTVTAPNGKTFTLSRLVRAQ
jgi:Tfp pilus assembly protein PilV